MKQQMHLKMLYFCFEKQKSIIYSISRLGDGWTAEEALSIGLYSALLHSDNFHEGIIAAVNHSGDSDSTGSICGSILGAINGINSIPDKYKEQVELYPLLCEIAEDLIFNEVTEDFANKYPGW